MEAVADPGLGEQVLRSRRILLDLFSQLIHEYAQVLDLVAVIRPPDRLQQLRMGNRHVRMRHQILQKLELQCEAEVLASLNHHNIAAIYDLQEAEGSRYVVLGGVSGIAVAPPSK